MSCRAVCWALATLWMAIFPIVRAVDGVVDAGPTPVNAPDTLPDVDTTWTPVTATPVQPPCSATTQEKLTKFSLFNIELERRCQEQSGGGNAFPFDAAPTREQLVRFSATPACLVVCKGLLRLVEHECLLGDYRMPVRATAETVLKLSQDRKDLARYPIPPEDVLQHQIVLRARMNTARDADPIGFSTANYPQEMLQYQPQLTKAYAAGGIVMLSPEFKILNDLSATESQVGSEHASAAVAELLGPTTPPATVAPPIVLPPSGSGIGASEEQDNANMTVSPSSGSHGAFRPELSLREPVLSGSGSITNAPVVTPQATSASTRTSVAFTTTTFIAGIIVLIV